MNNQTQDLANICEEIYLCFSNCKPSKPLDVCLECCVSENEEKLLRETSLRSLSSQLLHQWNHSAKSERPDINEWKYFLPRFFELVSQYDWPTHSEELAFKSFRYYSLHDWTDKELDLFNRFSETYFKNCLADGDIINNGAGLDSIIVMLSALPIKLEHLFDIWLADEGLASVQHFIEFTHWIDFQNDFNFTNSFADERVRSTVREWLLNESVIAIFQQRIENFILKPEGLTPELVISLNLEYEILSMKN